MSLKSDRQHAEKLVKGEKSEKLLQKNTVKDLLNRAIKFRKSRYVDHKLELFKNKFAPVNGIAGVVHATSAYDSISAGTDNVAEKVDENGFESPAKVLYAKDKLEPGWSEIHPVGSGLKDLGQLSSLNSVLQVLTYTPALANYLVERRHGSNCTIQDYCFVCAIEEHVRNSLKGSPYALQPRVFVGKLKKMTTGVKDVYNVWNYFMEQTQSFLLSEKRSKEKLIQETTALYQIFSGYIQQKLECPACNKSENIYNSFLNLSLDLTQCSSVERCLSKYFKKQIKLFKECDSCQQEIELSGSQSIYKTPMVLSIQLQRFNQDAGAAVTKINKVVKFEESIDISRVVTESEKVKVNTKYNLFAMIVHTGESINDGRYIAYVKSSNGIWYCMDNENVQVTSVKKVMEEKPYMLFYTIPPKIVKQVKKAIVPAKKSVSEKVKQIEKEEDESLDEMEEEEDNVLPTTRTESDDEEEEKVLEAEKLSKAMDEASKKEKIENSAAIVVDHNENMKSKREKLGALIEKETQASKSAEAKQELLTKKADNQFQDEIDTWDDGGSTIEGKRKSALKQFKAKRKKVDMYDIDYDRGKIKKVKTKKEDIFHKPNMFQITAEMKSSKKKNGKK